MGLSRRMTLAWVRVIGHEGDTTTGNSGWLDGWMVGWMDDGSFNGWIDGFLDRLNWLGFC